MVVVQSLNHWLLIAVASLVARQGLQGAWAQQSQQVGSAVAAHGLLAMRQVESSWTRDPTCVPCIGRWTLNHWTIKEMLNALIFTLILYLVALKISLINYNSLLLRMQMRQWTSFSCSQPQEERTQYFIINYNLAVDILFPRWHQW